MKTILCTLLLAVLSAATAAKADEVTITFDQADQTITPGGTIQYFGTITNDTDSTIYLNSDDLTLAGLSLTTTDQFYNNVPISLAASGQAGDSSGDIELFDVTASSPLLDADGTFAGSYVLLGGADGGTDTAMDVLATSSFNVTTTPEPSAICMLIAGLSTVLFMLWRKSRPQAADVLG